MDSRTIIPFFFLLSSCTSFNVEPLDNTKSIANICIEENPKVIVKNFVPIIRDLIESHGIETYLYSNSAPEFCDTILTYTARQHWDFKIYLGDTELKLYDLSGNLIAQGNYEMMYDGWFDPAKWHSIETKIKPVIDGLLKNHTYDREIIRTKNIFKSKDNNLERFETIKQLYDNGMITEEEYSEKKKELLNGI